MTPKENDPKVPLAENEFGPVLREFARRYFESVRFPERAEQSLRALHEKGFVVHVMRSSTWVNYLYLTWALIRRGLPPIRAVVNLRRWFTRPWRLTAQRGAAEVRFTYARRMGGSGLVFLRRAALGVAEGRTMKDDPFPALVALARRGDRPVYLVPELVVWERTRERLTPNLLDRIFGTPDVPGFLYSVIAFLRNFRRAHLRVGEPVDLRRFVEQNPNDADEVLARKIRGALHQHLARETRAVFGPPRKPAARILDETMRDRVLRRTLDEVARETGRRPGSVQREARRNLEAIAARPSTTVLGVLAPVLDWVFMRIYDGIVVDEAGLDRAMRAAARAPVVLCASHKSHVDYLVMSWVLWNRGYMPPVVAAGANLSFWPLGWIFRRGGAFFLRRSFKGDKIYAAAFRAYVKKLVHEGVLQEFFPEGGRSRTGKLLPAKLGLFTWEVDAVMERARDDLVFVPVAIDYEKVVESSSYSKELAGGEKAPETLRGLLSVRKVLSARYGRIHLRFAEPVSLNDFAAARGVDLTDAPSEDAKKALVRALGHRIMWGVGCVSTITPQALVAAALLAWRGRGIPAPELGRRVGVLRRFAEKDGTPLSPTLVGAPSDPTVIGAIMDALRVFADDGLIQTQTVRDERLFRAVDERRVELAFYRNTLMNWIAPRSIVASAVLAKGELNAVDAVRSRALFLSRLFKLEFIFRVDAEFEALFDEAAESLQRAGLLVRTADALHPPDDPELRSELEFLADLLRDHLESYLVAVRALDDLVDDPMERRAFTRNVLELGRFEWLEGRLGAPEAINRPTAENAVAWFVDRGILVEEDKKLRLAGEGAIPAARAELAESVRRFVR